MRFARELHPLDHGPARVAPDARKPCPFDHALPRVALDARKLCLLDHRLRRMTGSACNLDLFDRGQEVVWRAVRKLGPFDHDSLRAAT